MYLLNFSHPITAEQIEQIESLIKPHKIIDIITIKTAFNNDEPFQEQINTLLEQIPFSTEELASLPMLINLPAHSVIASLLIAHLHGLLGFFPAIIRLKPLTNTIPTQFVLAEIINLQLSREQARSLRA
jgi:hypothetical protein